MHVLVELVRSSLVRARAVRLRARRQRGAARARRCGSCATRATTSGPGRPRWDGDAHAGRIETSLMLALAPALVGAAREPGNVEPLAALMPRLRAGGVRAVGPERRPRRPDRRLRRGGPRAAGGGDRGPRARSSPQRCRRRGRSSRGTAASARRRRVTRPRVAPPRTRLARRRRGVPTARAASGVALVTGAARGIGAATVQRLALEGWHVVAVDRAEDDPRLPYALGTTPRSSPPLANERVQPDRGRRDRRRGARRSAVEIAERRWGGLDAVVAAAGVIAGGVPAWELDAEQERAVLEVNLGGVLTAARVGIPALLGAPSRATGASSPSPRPPPPAGCRCSPPTAPPRRA